MLERKVKIKERAASILQSKEFNSTSSSVKKAKNALTLEHEAIEVRRNEREAESARVFAENRMKLE